MSSAEASFRESLKAFNTGGGNSSGRTGISAAVGNMFGGSSTDPEGVSESLLGSFQNTASRAFSSVGSSIGMGPRNPDTECFGLTTFQRYMAFGLCFGASLLCFMVAFFAAPFLVVFPAKFSVPWTLGSILFMSSFGFLNGWLAQLKSLFSSPRLPFTISYLSSMALTLYFSMISPSYVFALVFSFVQMVALGWYIRSYFPGGASGLGMMTRGMTGSLPV